jgi:hypothetical protein
VPRLERIDDFSGAYKGANYRAVQNTVGGLWLKNEQGVILHVEAPERVPLFPVGDATRTKSVS